MKLAVVGSRSFTDQEKMTEILDIIQEEYGFDTIVSGGADGADKLAEKYAAKRGKQVLTHPIQWGRYEDRHKIALERNKRIWDDADYGIAFWDGKSPGTRQSLSISKQQKKLLLIYNFKTNLLERRNT